MIFSNDSVALDLPEFGNGKAKEWLILKAKRDEYFL